MTAAIWAGVMLMGGLGSVARFVLDRAVARRVGGPFPFGTFTVNVLGSLLLGLVSGLVLSHTVALLVGTAVMGAFTTFSTWMFETQRLAEELQIRTAVANIGVSLVVGLGAAAFGQWIAGLL
ncbi:MAG: fluoride efflux transporter CrcB [Mycobacterium sp.]